MTNSLRRSSSEPSLRPPGALRRALQAALGHLHRRRNNIARRPPPSEHSRFTSSSSLSSDLEQTAPSVSAELFDTDDVRLFRRIYRLKFLERGPDSRFVERTLTRREILDEVRKLAQPLPRERLPFRPHTHPYMWQTRSNNIHRNPSMSPPPRRNHRSTEKVRPRGRGPVPSAIADGRRNQASRRLLTVDNLNVPHHFVANRLTVRDMRQIDPKFTPKPAIWVREEAMLVSLESVRAIILFDRMFLFDPDNDNVKASLWHIEKSLAQGYESNFSPFEFRALEGILIHTCTILERDFARIEPELRHILINLPNHISNEMLESLRLLEQRLKYYVARSRKVQHAIQAVLDEDEDMAEMYLTEKRKNPNLVRNPLDHDDVEMLLETYLQMVDDLSSRAGLLQQAIDDTENLIDMHLGTMQNRVLMVNLVITTTSTTLGFGALVTSIFGMNLRLPGRMIEPPNGTYFFAGTVCLAICAMGFALWFVTQWCRRKGLFSGRLHSHARKKAQIPPPVFKAVEDVMKQAEWLFGTKRSVGALRRRSVNTGGLPTDFHESADTKAKTKAI